MYPLPKHVDLSFLVGAKLLQCCVGENELILNFDKEIRITVLSDFAVKAAGGASVVRYTRPTGGAGAVLPLLGDTVTRATATDHGGLLLAFTSGAHLELFDTSVQFESFWIQHKKTQIVV